MGILSSTKERVKSAVPGLKTKQRKMSEAAVKIADMQGVPVGQFRCEMCSTQKSIVNVGNQAITKSPEGEVQVLIICKTCSRAHEKGGAHHPEHVREWGQNSDES